MFLGRGCSPSRRRRRLILCIPGSEPSILRLYIVCGLWLDGKQKHRNKLGMGMGITALRRGAVLASVTLHRRLLVALKINKDRAYDWFLA
ncbi:hypothetical protein F5888DRAFT_1747157 [Russula emetica]|nr:hypothetical protein F5888DRAFT_1747157 [Russula emetica]